MMNKEVLIVIPAYNEEDSIGEFLDSLTASEAMNFADIIVVNDASTDATATIVRNKNIKLITHPYNLGYGTALQTGYKYALEHHYEYVIQIDGDGQHDVCNIPRIYDSLRSATQNLFPADLIIGSRFLKESQSFSVSLFKKIAIAFFRSFIKLTSGQNITDPTSGLQGLSRSVFSYYADFGNFDNNYPDANMIVQMSLLGFHIEEIPAVMHERKAGKSMHFGIIEPIFYMFVMIFSTCNVYLRSKWHMYSNPNRFRGDVNFDKK